MKERIENSISQRNKMFSSISHDIRTILTRMKLNLELQKLNKGGLKKDLIEMEEMVEEYLNYAKGEKEEKIKKINIVKLLNLIKKRYLKKNIYFNNKQKINVMIRTNSIKRCIHNLLSKVFYYYYYFILVKLHLFYQLYQFFFLSIVSFIH